MFAKIYKFILVIFLILAIAVALAAGGLLVVYQMYLSPKPAEFEFSKSAESMEKVEIVNVTDLRSGKPKYNTVAEISDVEGFLSDFGALECSKGLPLSILTKLEELDSLIGIKITYADESFEVITAYGNINSDIFTVDLNPEDLLNRDFFFFDEAKFNALIEKYK